MADQGPIQHYLKRFVLVRRGGISASGKPYTRLAFISRLTRDRNALRGKLLNVGGRLHGTAATKNVTIDIDTVEADWPQLPTPAELNRAKEQVEPREPASA